MGQALEPEPIADSTRQFLRPLVGIDPASVPVYRGELAARLAQAHAADAITIGGQVMLAAGQSTAGPSGAALLAHELTHVARHRQPRFVPPVLADAGPAAGSPYAPPKMAVAPTAQVPRPVPIDQDNEEAVAGSVERAVRHAAGLSESAAGLDSGPHQVGVPAHQPLTDDDQPSGSAAWGGLPAPWEPLPAWLTTPAPAPSSTAPSAPAAYAAADHTLGGANLASGPALTEAASLGGGTPSGPGSLSGPANLGGGASLGGASVAGGRATLSGAGGLSGAGNLSGAAYLSGPANLSGAVSMGGAASLSGAASMGGASVASGLHLGGPGSLTGAANLGGAASLGGAGGGSGLAGSGVAGGGSGLAGGGDAALPVFAAEHGRDTDAEPDRAVAAAGVTPAPQGNPHEGTVEPDLDALARQVYTVLRRRLASEQRRFG